MIKFLIIRLSSIGDIVLTSPIVRCLKQQAVDTEIHFLTKTKYAEILENNLNIDKVHTFDGDLNKTIAKLKLVNFHYIIDLHNNFRTAKIKRDLGIVAFTVNKLNFKKWLLVNLKINKLPQIHIVDRYLKTLSFFDIKNDNKGLDYFIPEKDKISISTLSNTLKKEYITIVIGAAHFTKQIPSEKIIEIITKINYPIILLGDNNDNEKAEFIIKNTQNIEVINACGKYNLNQTASIINQSKLVITSDTGLMHIAAALKKTIISIWGNTVPSFGMYPYLTNEKSVIIENENLKCRPCSKIGFEKCPKKHFKCMTDINIDEIAQFANKIIAKT